MGCAMSDMELLAEERRDYDALPDTVKANLLMHPGDMSNGLTMEQRLRFARESRKHKSTIDAAECIRKRLLDRVGYERLEFVRARSRCPACGADMYGRRCLLCEYDSTRGDR